MAAVHTYNIHLKWTGNNGTGTETYRGYSRDHTISTGGKPELLASSDPHFRGNKERYNPEEMLLASVSSCHMLSYLHLCAVNKIVVVEYSDHPIGKMIESPDGSGRFEEISLNPAIVVTEKAMIEKATALHHEANKLCFIANSLNFPVRHFPAVMAME
ncbi:MAG TPA: OsmC family protein [Bacteroidia bacterium]|jgi:organic hydroperoxide reductase OsmC/OhrA|nr:OsmC family protein [Bacteroidia bacterium]